MKVIIASVIIMSHIVFLIAIPGGNEIKILCYCYGKQFKFSIYDLNINILISDIVLMILSSAQILSISLSA